MMAKQSISKRYSRWFSAISLVMLAVMTASAAIVLWRGAGTLKDALRAGTRESFEKTQLANMNSLVNYLRQIVAPSLYKLDIEDINRLIRELKRDASVDFVRIADSTGKVLTDGTRENSSYGMKLSVSEAQFKASPILMRRIKEGYQITFWVGAEGYTMGYGEITFSEEPLKQATERQEKAVTRIWQGFTAQFMTIALFGALMVLLITVALSAVFSRTFSQPLVRLRDATRRIAAGDLDYRVHIESDDEIGELAGSFNRMVEDLQRGTEELAEANRALLDEIEERTLAERNLAAEKERLTVTLKSIGDGVVTTDTEGRVLLMNAVAEELTGYPYQEAHLKSIGDTFHIFDEKTNEPLENPVDAVLRSGTPVDNKADVKFINRSGTALSINFGCSPIRDGDGAVIGTVLVFRDRTERRKLRNELLKINKLESVGILAGGIAHDFNNLLTGILGNISLAKFYIKPEDKAYERLAEAEKASTRAQELTQQLLTFSKGGAPVKKTVSLRELIVDSCRFVLRGSNVKCVFSFPEELWPVNADEGQINQVIHNLIINADQAMPGGGEISLSAENVKVNSGSGLPLKEGDYIKISIKDQGVGISKENIAKIFDPYFTTKEKGEGLGLATTYSIIKKHGGYIAAESEAGAGATFYFYLPASKEKVASGKNVTDEIVTGQGKILVMDDDLIIQDLARAMLTKLGYEVEIAPNGEKAIELYRQALETGAPFDAVFLDLTVPGGMGGKEVIGRLCAIDENVKAIVSSGYSNDPIMADYKNYGFSGVVTKPFNVQKLSAALSDLMQGKKLH